jgi:transposase-like protein
MKYPCRECIIIMCCSELCDKVTNDKDEIRDSMISQSCPDCNGFLKHISKIIVNNLYQFECQTCRHHFEEQFDYDSYERI